MNNKRLYRSTTDRMLGGVAAGLAEFFGLDVSLIRLLFVLMFLLGGHGLLVYIILWIVVPERPAGATIYTPTDRDPTDPGSL